MTAKAKRPADDTAEADVATIEAPIDVLAEAKLALAQPTIEAGRLRDILARMGLAQRVAEDAASLAEASEAEKLLDATDEEADEFERSIVLNRRRASRLSKAADLLRRKVVETDDADLEEARRVRYTEADHLRQEAKRWVDEIYREHAMAIAEGLQRHAEIIGIIEAANADRPKGMPHLSAERFRDLEATAGEVTFVDQTYYVDRDGEEVLLTGNRVLGHRGGVNSQELMVVTAGGGAENGTPVFARIRQVPSRSEPTPGASPRPLLASVFLPRVRYEDQDFWPRRSAAW